MKSADQGQKNEPLEGFDIQAYDEKTKEVVIQIHTVLFKYPKQQEALGRKAIEIMEHEPNVDRVTFVRRKT